MTELEIKNLKQINLLRLIQRELERKLDREGLTNLVVDIKYILEQDNEPFIGISIYNTEFLSSEDGYGISYIPTKGQDIRKWIFSYLNEVLKEENFIDMNLSKE